MNPPQVVQASRKHQDNQTEVTGAAKQIKMQKKLKREANIMSSKIRITL